MPRIRSVKPSFLRHEGLQELEESHPTARVMLVFLGLWMVADKAGRFEWRPKTLKLDILPFLDYDLGASLELLREAGFVSRYTTAGKSYGVVLNFTKHQRISGKEALEPPKFPEPQQGSISEAIGQHLPGQEGERVTGVQEAECFPENETPDLPASALAKGFLEKINYPITHDNLRTIAAALDAVALEHSTSITGALDWLVAKALADRDEGIEINRFYFTDGKYRHHGKRSASTQTKRSHANRGTLANALRDYAGARNGPDRGERKS